MRNEFIAFSLIAPAVLAAMAYWVWSPLWWLFAFLGPVILLGYYDMIQKRHSIMRIFPVLGRGRYLMEEWRPKLYQYFIESDTNGTPISRVFRSLVYTRAKKTLDTKPFGTQFDVYAEGYEWMNHSIAALDHHELEASPRILIGEGRCEHPYASSLLNVAAMSYGSISRNAVMALNGGAAIGGFAHNTGEGGISPHHLKFGGDLIFQIGTGYFGARDEEGRFSDEVFKQSAGHESVKMVELKLSQGAKPGHGGILPARKNTAEIAKIRGVVAGQDVISPPYHTAFSTPIQLLEFLARLRELSGGKPVGFKLCIGQPHEFMAICKAMVETGLLPDFVTIDGGEGGTGAAPVEFSNSVGMPFREGLAFASDMLIGFGLKDEVKLLASGKIISGFHMFRALALGADACYSARAMMLALGCIQALECNKNTCPTGVTTQNPELVQGLVVSNKKHRVANYHKETVEGLVELMAAAGLRKPGYIQRQHVYRRVSMHNIQSYSDLYPDLEPGCLLEEKGVPPRYKPIWDYAQAKTFGNGAPILRAKEFPRNIESI